MAQLKIAIAGANGRMGRTLVQAVEANPNTILVGALDRAGSGVLGLDAGFALDIKTGVKVTDNADIALDDADVLIDFTRPSASLPLIEKCAAKGIKKRINIPTYEECDVCHGSGAKPGTFASTCSTCHGSGTVHVRQAIFQMQQTCPTCHGTGKEIKDPCVKCRGEGRTKTSKTVEVNIPAGIDDGQRIRLSGEGEPGTHGAPAGDLYVNVRVKEHKIFERNGLDLHCELPISFAVAALGGEVEVPTLDGKVKLNIPKETQTGRRMRVKGKGIKSLRSSATGDLYCHVVVETPVNLTDRQKELLEEFEKISTGLDRSQTPRKKSFWDKVGELFD